MQSDVLRSVAAVVDHRQRQEFEDRWKLQSHPFVIFIARYESSPFVSSPTFNICAGRWQVIFLEDDRVFMFYSLCFLLVFYVAQ
jgi:hypothetical protein